MTPLDFDDQGAVAKLDKAPVSKTGDSRFESWLPRSHRNSAADPGFRAQRALQRRVIFDVWPGT